MKKKIGLREKRKGKEGGGKGKREGMKGKDGREGKGKEEEGRRDKTR